MQQRVFRIWLWGLTVSLTAAILSPLPASAQTTPVKADLELVLLADASGSIDNGEILFQRQGYADALKDPDLVGAMTRGYWGRVALTYVEWASADSQEVVVGWTMIDGPEAAAAFGDQLMAAPRLAYGRNAIGAALMTAVRLIETNDIDGARRVIDFSGDSANNWNGPTIAEGRAAAVDKGMTINGLAILCRFCNGRPIAYDLEAAFQNQIIGGPGAFVITADSNETFAAAVRQKLFLEVSWATSQRRAALDPPRRLNTTRPLNIP
ncbi:MAG: DUF1194 domain-containing protein [Rhodobacteraceae bacterium]|nr:DUF1194 domain-containing protein [Paracoccaceae bacterium]